jgi:hypothetical protein
VPVIVEVRQTHWATLKHLLGDLVSACFHLRHSILLNGQVVLALDQVGGVVQDLPNEVVERRAIHARQIRNRGPFGVWFQPTGGARDSEATRPGAPSRQAAP